MPDDLLDNYASALLWNQPAPLIYWFHYTSRLAAREIADTGVFKVGTRHAAGRAGIYVCPYQPGSLSEEELARRILDGSFFNAGGFRPLSCSSPVLRWHLPAIPVLPMACGTWPARARAFISPIRSSASPSASAASGGIPTAASTPPDCAC